VRSFLHDDGHSERTALLRDMQALMKVEEHNFEKCISLNQVA